jgi:exodeoxyribonuclease III
MIISAWNLNSIKSRKEHLVDWLKENNPNIVLLQELKAITENFPYEEIEELGYNCAVHGQKTYNGVSILSKSPIEDVTTSFLNDPNDTHSRYIQAVTYIDNQAIRVASLYAPNGGEVGSDKFLHKLEFFDALYEHIKELLKLEETLAIGGDYNIAPETIDVYDPESLEKSTCFTAEERAKMHKILNLGMVDSFRAANPDKQQFSWWDYRGGSYQHNKGMRIDHILLSPEAADMCTDAGVDTEPRDKAKPSDHAPIWAKLG